VGSPGNRQATDLFAQVMSSFAFEVQSPPFDCMDWHQEGVGLTVGGLPFQAFASPYSLGCRVYAPLVVVSTLAELEAAELAGKVVLLRGDLTRGQLMPKNFTFYNPDEHKRIYALLEAKQPMAIIAATSRDAEMVGGQYPFPLFEDGDFDIPSVYMTDVEGDRMVQLGSRDVWLESRASRTASKGNNVVARKETQAKHRVVLFAHIDSRMGTPGANDNASGVMALLLLAELLSDYQGRLGIELVAVNGEDYYSNPGEMKWLAMNAGKFDEIVLGINLDDVGYFRGKVAYSLYDCPEEMAATIRKVLAHHADLMEGPPWYQGDHGLFLAHGRPALAFTTELLSEVMADITHTAKDTAETVDPAKPLAVAVALRDLLLQLTKADALSAPSTNK
jgi:aminopeptidase YwaD